jgi:hypothetical protein
MTGDARGSCLDVYVFHSLRLTTEAWYAIADRYDRFLNIAVDARGDARAWWRPSSAAASAGPRDGMPAVSDAAVDALLAEPLPHWLSSRVTRCQRAQDFAIDAFAEVGRLRLTERSYSLAINSHKQCMVIFRFGFAAAPGDEAIGSDIAAEIVTMARDRRVYRNIGQQAYASKALADAVAEIRVDFEANVAGQLRGESVVIADDDFAFPIFVSASVDPSVACIFDNEEQVSLERTDPVYFGWNYGLVCGQGPAATRDCLSVFAFMQFSYHNVRQYEGFLDREMARTSLRTRRIDTDRAASIVGNLTHTFEWFHLDFFRHLGTLNPSLHATADELVRRWRLDASVRRMHDALIYHREYVNGEYARAAQRDTRRQEAILFLIALLQLFALISVLVDFQSLHGVTQDARKLLDPELVEWEWWGLQHVGSVPRVILALSLTLAFAFYGPNLLRWLRRATAGAWRALVRRLGQRGRDVVRALAHLRHRVVVARSHNHGLGLFPLFAFDAGDTILDLDAGIVKTALPDDAASAEWSYRDGRYYVRPWGTAYRFINHSRQPNASATLAVDGESPRLVVTALRRIARGEEILLDYRAERLPFAYIRDAGGYL